MTRDRFKKTMFSPYFQSDYYKNESAAGKIEKSIESFFIKLFSLGKKNRSKD